MELQKEKMTGDPPDRSLVVPTLVTHPHSNRPFHFMSLIPTDLKAVMSTSKDTSYIQPTTYGALKTKDQPSPLKFTQVRWAVGNPSPIPFSGRLPYRQRLLRTNYKPVAMRAIEINLRCSLRLNGAPCSPQPIEPGHEVEAS